MIDAKLFYFALVNVVHILVGINAMISSSVFEILGNKIMFEQSQIETTSFSCWDENNF